MPDVRDLMKALEEGTPDQPSQVPKLPPLLGPLFAESALRDVVERDRVPLAVRDAVRLLVREVAQLRGEQRESSRRLLWWTWWLVGLTAAIAVMTIALVLLAVSGA